MRLELTEYYRLIMLACTHAQLCLTLFDPMDWSLPGCSVHGMFQARILEWVAISYSRGYFNQKTNKQKYPKITDW